MAQVRLAHVPAACRAHRDVNQTGKRLLRKYGLMAVVSAEVCKAQGPVSAARRTHMAMASWQGRAGNGGWDQRLCPWDDMANSTLRGAEVSS